MTVSTRSYCLTFASLMTAQALIACGPGTAPPPDPSADLQYLQYLSFQLGRAADPPTIDTLVRTLGGTGDGKKTQLAFTVGPLSLNNTDAQMRQLIDAAFSLATQKNIAVAFHIDDSMFWEQRTDLIADTNNVEWTDWIGTVYPHRVIGWAPVQLAPPICYESSVIRTEIKRIAKDVIGAEIASQLKELDAQGKSNLFAGVITGWETHLDDDRQPPVKFGYCSLSKLGFSATNLPGDMDKELVGVVQRWIELWTGSLAAAGLPTDKIYTHVPLAEGVHAPPSVAFNASSRPGFSAYENQYSALLGDATQNELARNDNPHWAMSEGTNAMVGCSGQTSPISYEVYLGKLFNHGASLVNIFGWAGGVTPPAGQDPWNIGGSTNGPDGIAAFQKFLTGGTLDPDDSPVPDSVCSGGE